MLRSITLLLLLFAWPIQAQSLPRDPAGERVKELEKRVGDLEAKLDRLLALLDQSGQGQGADVAASVADDVAEIRAELAPAETPS